LPNPSPWAAIVPENEIALMRSFYNEIDMTEDEFKPKSKESRQLLKIAEKGRKRINIEEKKKKSKDPTIVKKKEKKKVIKLVPPNPAVTPA
jgi:hypothetical protein